MRGVGRSATAGRAAGVIGNPLRRRLGCPERVKGSSPQMSASGKPGRAIVRDEPSAEGDGDGERTPFQSVRPPAAGSLLDTGG